MKEQMRRMETAEMRSVRAVVGYRMTDGKRKEDITEELGIADINTTIENGQYRWLEHFERMRETESSKLLR
jgi:hypothetical protein